MPSRSPTFGGYRTCWWTCSSSRSTGPPGHLAFDVDAVDDPAHGQQQLIMFHGYYDHHQYLSIVITCAENDMAVLVGLRHGTATATLGVDNDLRFLGGRLRAVSPDVHIHVRGDCGFGVPMMYNVCRELRLSHTFGIAMIPVLCRLSDDLLKQAAAEHERNGQPQRLFLTQPYRAESWPAEQPIVIKVEAHAEGTNRRAVLTNRPGVTIQPQGVYDEYAERGESENRNKELKRELQADRLRDHRFMLHIFRLYLHTFAFTSLVRLRHVVVQSPPTSGDLGLPTELPTAAIDGGDRKRFFNRRRQRDPLGEGFASTWRTRLIKVAAEVIARATRHHSVVRELAAPGPLPGRGPSRHASDAQPRAGTSLASDRTER
jgi:hypothetical protein